jgi:putative SOS response-associated peptidase YedK
MPRLRGSKTSRFPRGISASALPRTVNNFYGWKKWENRRSPADEWVRSFAIVSTTPNELCVELHNWIPWFWVPRFGRYGGEEPVDLRRLKDLLAPYPVEEMTCWPVSTRSAMSGTMTRA